MSLREVERLLRDPVYKRVAETDLPDGRWVSTVWLGLDHRFGSSEAEPLIFETMVFESKDRLIEQATKRSSNENLALVGHDVMVFSCCGWLEVET